jgi:hypothetical protein
MMINTDYAQYWAWGHREEQEPPKPKEPEPKKDDSIKSNVTLPKWLKNGRARDKL